MPDVKRNQAQSSVGKPWDMRLHTLRHTVASVAVMHGVPAPVVSRLPGHANPRMTLRYAHLADRDIKAAAERIGAALARVLALRERLRTG